MNMKLTKSQLKRIIKEELENLNISEIDNPMAAAEEAAEEEAEAGEKLKTDVGVVLKYIENINDVIEYSQLLKKVLEHDVPKKGVAFRQLAQLWKAGLKSK